MRGSSFPALDDSFATINEATTPYTGNVANEIAESVEATQTAVGANPSDLTSIGGTDHGTVKTLLEVLCRMEVGIVAFTAGTSTAAGTMTSGRFSTAANIKIFLYPEPSGTNVPSGDDTFAVDTSSVTTTGFTAVRNISNGAPDTGARNYKFLAVEWPD